MSFVPLKNVSVTKKLMLVLGLMLLISILNFGTIRYFQSLQKADGAIIDASGRDRMLSQRTGFYAEQVIFGSIKGEDITEKKETLKSIIDLHDTSFYALKEGGIAPGIANDRVLPPTNDEIMSIVLEAEELWVEYKKNGYVIVDEPTLIDGEVNPEVAAAMKFIEDNGPEMLRRNNEMVKAYVKMNDDKQAKLNTALIVFLAISLIVVVFGYFVAQSIAKPLTELTNTADKLTDGDFSVKVPKVETKDEVSKIANMMGFLLEIIKKLKKKK